MSFEYFLGDHPSTSLRTSLGSTNIATTTTYFIGNYYEVTKGVVTKYYYAGSQRIALRSNGTLYYMVSTGSTRRLGDHLGSTSLSVNADTGETIETRYKPWGEVRYTTPNKTLPTQYTFTGQYSYQSDFGLLFYNARWVRLLYQIAINPHCISD